MNKKSIPYLILIIVFIFLTLFFGPIIANYNKTGSNTLLVNKDYSYLSRDQILSKIDQDFVLPDHFILVLPNQQETSLKLATISAQINKNEIANTMLSRRLNQGVIAYIKYFFKPKNFNLEITLDADKLNQQADLFASQIDKPFIPTELNYKNGSISVAVGSTGTQFDRDVFINNLNTLLLIGNFNQKIRLETQIIGSIPTNDQINNAKSRAQKLIKKSLILRQDSNQNTINNATLISWVGFNNNYQTDKINKYIEKLNSTFKKEGTDAIFKMENNKVVEFIPAQNGITIKTDELANLIIESLNKLINTEDLSEEITIPVTIAEPKIKNSDTNNLGINELLGQGVSTFNHSSATRNINVKKGSSIVNNILVAPDTTFSFIKNLGEVSLKNGYTNAYIIREGKTELDVGGGICQVSTTLFRAMLNAGLNIIQRQAHAYRVSYYEEDSKPGFDATVFIPSPDLKFINDTGHYVLIRNIYDGDNKKLTYEIYGTSDGRKTEISNYKQWGAQSAPPDVYIDDPTLEVGKLIKTESKVPGLKTSFDWTVTKSDGTMLHQKTFISNFVPWAAVYRRGTKTN
ncbi:MAG: VanW family protein [Candidatus Shapirobacteria bacterium]|nr:VanW family protein [Candidatus Shapirobacteria bacterium]MDD4383410.1 VanW family protein [Candidatus Shapirobacteria bacterium]